jgi:dCMP deaminase
MNAITNASNKPELDGASLYVSLFPCNECAKLIVQVGIREVVFLSDKYNGNDVFLAARRIFELAGVGCRQLKPNRREVVLPLDIK